MARNGKITPPKLSAKEQQMIDQANLRLVCPNCKTTNRIKFYKSYDQFNKLGYVFYCKDCIKNVLYPYYLQRYKDQNIAVHHLLRALNVCYIHDVYLTSAKGTGKPDTGDSDTTPTNSSSVIAQYFKNYNSMHDENGYGNSYADSVGVDKIESISSFETTIRVKHAQRGSGADGNYEALNYDIDYLRQKFGNFPSEDLAFLEEQYLQWADKLGEFIYEQSTSMNVIMLCCEYLKVRHNNENGVSAKNEIDSIQKIMSVSGLAEKANQNSQKIKSIGMQIEQIENERPVKPADSALNDVDGYRDIILAFEGATSRALGKENQFTREFDRVMGEYSLDILKETGVKKDGE